MSAQHHGWWPETARPPPQGSEPEARSRTPALTFLPEQQGASLQPVRALWRSPPTRRRAGVGTHRPRPLWRHPRASQCCPWGPLAGEAVLVCSAGFQGLPWTGPHPGCHISCPGPQGPRRRDSGWGSAGAVGAGPVEVTRGAPPLPETAGGRLDPEKPGRAFQEWPVPAPPLLLPEACVERGTCSGQRSLPSTLRPALEPPRECVCVCVCVCARDCEGQFPSGVHPHTSR